MCVRGADLLKLHLAGVGGGAVVQGLAGDAVRAMLLHARAGRPLMRGIHGLTAGRPLAHPCLQLLRPCLHSHPATLTAWLCHSI